MGTCQGDEEAFRYYEKALEEALKFRKEAQEKSLDNPDIEQVAILYKEISNMHSTRNNSIKAFEYYQYFKGEIKETREGHLNSRVSFEEGDKFLQNGHKEQAYNAYIHSIEELRKSIYPGKLLDTCINVAKKCFLMGKRNEGYKFLNEATETLEFINNKNVVEFCALEIGDIFSLEGYKAEAIDLYERSRATGENIPDHQTFFASYTIAHEKYHLGRFSEALVDVNKAINECDEYKRAHNLKGVILAELDQFQEALESYKRAKDENYDEPEYNIITLETHVKLREENCTIDEVRQFLDTKIKQYEAINTPEYHNNPQIGHPNGELIRSSMGRVGKALPFVDKRLCDDPSLILNLFKHLYRCLDSEKEVRQTDVRKLSRRINVSNEMNEKRDKEIDKLKPKEQEKELKEVKEQIIKFRDDIALKDYYESLYSELEAFYIAVQVISSGYVSQSQNSQLSSAEKYINKVVMLIPIIGEFASIGVSLVADIAQYKIAQKNANALSPIKELFYSLDEFKETSSRAAVNLTLDRAKRKDDIVGGITDDIRQRINPQYHTEDMSNFLEDIETKAKLFGKLDAVKIAVYLAEDGVIESLKAKRDINIGTPDYQSRYSIMADLITGKQSNPDISSPGVVPEVIEGKPVAERCCVIS